MPSEPIAWNESWRKDEVTDYINLVHKDQLMVNRHLVSKRRKTDQGTCKSGRTSRWRNYCFT